MIRSHRPRSARSSLDSLRGSTGRRELADLSTEFLANQSPIHSEFIQDSSHSRLMKRGRTMWRATETAAEPGRVPQRGRRRPQKVPEWRSRRTWFVHTIRRIEIHEAGRISLYMKEDS